MKIFVTGGTGLIGAYVIRALLASGYNDIVASKRKTSKMDLVQELDKVKWIECDLNDFIQMSDIISECDAVIHLAGMVSFSPWKKKEIFKANIDVTADLINVSLDQGIKRFIHFSSVAALGISNKMIDETAVWTENKSKKCYSLSKYLGEKEAWRGFAEGLNLSIINPSFTIGGGFWSTGPMTIFPKIENGLKYYPSGTNGCVDVRDVADMCIRLLNRDDLSGRRFICSGHNISHLDLMGKIGAEMNQSNPSKRVEGLFGELVWRGASTWARLSGTESLLSKEAYEISSAQLSYDNSQSIELLGMNYTDLDKTIGDTVQCYNMSKEKGFGILDAI